jgi:D-glycero-beta-D-manno-heptose-7-phosphate kinase
VRVTREEERIGGAANVAYNIVTLGAQAALLSVVGEDEASHKLEELVTATGIAAHFGRDAQMRTTVKLRVIGRQQQLVRIDFEEAPTDTVLRDKLTQFNSLVANYDVIIFSDYAKGSLVNVAEMIATARQQGKRILVDPKGDDFARYAGASILTPNKSEMVRIVGQWKGEGDLTARAQKLRAELNLEALLLTRSEEGMSLYRDGDVQHFPTMAREVFDVSGAGDTVIATLAVMLGAGASLVDAVAMANRAGGIVVGKLGTATVTREELLEG